MQKPQVERVGELADRPQAEKDQYQSNAPGLHRTEPKLGAQQPHLTPLDGPNARRVDDHVGFDASREAGVLHDIAGLLRRIEDHQAVVSPRFDDLDLSQLRKTTNAVSTRTDSAVDVISITNATTSTKTIRTLQGYRAHVTRVSALGLSPTFDQGKLAVTITAKGRTITANTRAFACPLILDLRDELVLTMTNNDSAAQTVQYSVEGWLRRKD